jgi:hypothetical protein
MPRCRVAAFEFFGGLPARREPDNPKTGGPPGRTNRSHNELAAHHGCLIAPALKPRDKAGSDGGCPCPGQFLRESSVAGAAYDQHGRSFGRLE